MSAELLRKVEAQLTAAHMSKNEIEAWIRACTKGRTALTTSGAMAHLRDRSIACYSYHMAQSRLWAIAEGCSADATHAEMWTRERIGRIGSHYSRKNGTNAKPQHTRIVLVAIERGLCVMAPGVDRRFILDEINALPRLTDKEAKIARMRDCEALWDCGVGYINDPHALMRPQANADVTRRTGVQIAALSEWAFRLQVFTDIELWLDHPPPDNYPNPCLTRRFGHMYIEFAREEQSDKALPPSQPISKRLAAALEDHIDGARERLRASYDGRRLWVSSLGGPLNANGLYKQIVAKTEAAFGLPVNPHLFRDCHATSGSKNSPEEPSTTHLQLGNTPMVTRHVYDHSGPQEASLILSRASDAIISRQLAMRSRGAEALQAYNVQGTSKRA